MTNLLLVGTGGFLGSVSRYLIGEWVLRLSGNHWFPFATFSVNVIGSLLIGIFIGMAESNNVLDQSVRLFIVVGFLGGFTTFSSFSHETVGLMRDTQTFAALLNIIGQVTVCLTAAWFGHYLTKLV